MFVELIDDKIPTSPSNSSALLRCLVYFGHHVYYGFKTFEVDLFLFDAITLSVK